MDYDDLVPAEEFLIMNLVQAAVYIAAPVVLHWLNGRSRIVQTLSPVVLCYGVGIALANTGVIDLDPALAENFMTGAVLVAVPLLLLSADFGGWLRLAGGTVAGTASAFFSVVAASALLSALFSGSLPEAWRISGMLVGAYTGSVPNLAAVGAALSAPAETMVMVQIADLLVCGALCLVFLSPVIRKVAFLLPAFEPRQSLEPASAEWRELKFREVPRGHLAAGLGAGAVCAAVAGAVGLLAPEEYRQLAAVMAGSTLALAASFVPVFKRIKGTYELGQFIFLIFCVAVGSLASVSRLAQSDGAVFALTGAVILLSLTLHFGICRMIKVDGHTAVITATAAIYSPAFVGPVAGVLKNREIVVSGITAGLLGLAVGNYLGILTAHAVRIVVSF